MRRLSAAGFAVVSLVAAAALVVMSIDAPKSMAHCQVPCGIYDDAARIAHMKEDAVTITKAIKNINDLAGKHEAQAFNQAARWVSTKEQHASHVITVVSEYFLTQKVKPVAKGADGYDAYLSKLADHHAVMVAAMKTKQQASLEAAAALDRAIEKLASHY